MSPRADQRAATLVDAVDCAKTAITMIGSELIEVVTVTRGRICLQPVVLAEGEAIARSLGLTVPLDHRMFVPGHTLWTGERNGLEIQVRSVLRQALGATW